MLANLRAAYSLSVPYKAPHRWKIKSQLARQDPNPWHHSHTPSLAHILADQVLRLRPLTATSGLVPESSNHARWLLQAYAGLCNHKTGLGHPIPPPPSPNHQKNMADFRPVARIFARGGYVSVGYYVCMYNHARQGGSGGMLHQEIF